MLTFHPRNRTLAFKQKCLFTAVLFACTLTFAADSPDGPKDAVVLIIRHAEDGGTGHDLAPRGHERAEAYKNYFLNLTADSKRLEPSVVLAAKASKQSHRPRLTVEPFAKAAKLPIDSRDRKSTRLNSSHQII